MKNYRENERPYLNLLQLPYCQTYVETKMSKHTQLIIKNVQYIESWEEKTLTGINNV